MSEETKENVIEGLIADQILYGKKYEPGVKFSYSTCLPLFANRFNGKLALYLMLEHTPEIMCPILSGLMEEGVMPPGLIIFAASGILEPTLAGGEPRGMRTLELDEFSRNVNVMYLGIGAGAAGAILGNVGQGIVGVVMSVSKNFATIMPVLHSDSRNSVKVKRTGISGSLVWDGKDYRYALVVDVPATHQFEDNDTIVTSGLANDFPEGVPVGYVVEAEPLSGSGFYRVKIRLATDFNKLDHVYVINNRFREEQEELMSSMLEK